MTISADNSDINVDGSEVLEVENNGVDLEGEKLCLNFNYISEPLMRVTDDEVFYYMDKFDKPTAILMNEKEVSRNHWMVMPYRSTEAK